MPDRGTVQSGWRPVLVVMAVYKPDPSFLEFQIASIATQTHRPDKLIAVIADLVSGELVADMCLRHGLTLETLVPEASLSSVRAFEAGLRHAVDLASEDSLIALADQDDIWHADKIDHLVKELNSSGAGLAHCDARVVDADGKVLHQSLHRLERRDRAPDLRGLLIVNNVTGMCSLMTRSVAAAALPFPPQAALFFHHDLWLGMVASVLGGVRRLDRALVDYRQHGGNVVGAVEEVARRPRLGSRAWVEDTAGRYSVAVYLAKSLAIRMDEVVASGTGDPDRNALAALKPYLSRAGVGMELAGDAIRLAASGRFDRAAVSLGFALVRAGRLAWALRDTARHGLLPALSRIDRKLFARAPGAEPGTWGGQTEEARSVQPASTYFDPRMRARFSPRIDPNQPGRFVVMVPTLNPPEIFAGVATALDIGLGMASRGHDVVFLASDMPVGDPGRTRAFLERRSAELPGDPMARVSVACGVRSPEIAFSPEDRFLATAWWTAHVIDRLLGACDFAPGPFYYLIQDYEPGFYPWGAEYAGALSSYSLEFIPIFNSTTLRDHFSSLGLVRQRLPGLAFHPAIDVARYAGRKRSSGARRRLAVYGRPEVARNLFPTAVESLARFLEKVGPSPASLELLSVGLKHDDIAFPGGHVLRSLGKIPWEDYPDFLSGVDIGLSLMLSPHPSHPPIEMAAAGARVVTNSFSTKDLGRLTPAILSVEPEPGAVARALGVAWAAGPVTHAERNFDLSALGEPIGAVTDRLSGLVNASRSPAKRALSAR